MLEKEIVKAKYPDAFEVNHDDLCKCCGDHCVIAIYVPSIKRCISSYKATPERAWLDAAARISGEDRGK